MKVRRVALVSVPRGGEREGEAEEAEAEPEVAGERDGAEVAALARAVVAESAAATGRAGRGEFVLEAADDDGGRDVAEAVHDQSAQGLAERAVAPRHALEEGQRHGRRRREERQRAAAEAQQEDGAPSRKGAKRQQRRARRDEQERDLERRREVRVARKSAPSRRPPVEEVAAEGRADDATRGHGAGEGDGGARHVCPEAETDGDGGPERGKADYGAGVAGVAQRGPDECRRRGAGAQLCRQRRRLVGADSTVERRVVVADVQRPPPFARVAAVVGALELLDAHEQRLA
mmetsp:Transcript_10797/g.38057  ORF Transcript_10797/g.38057 Transcript_10797/m.38057 type:complete len:289 (+) Transcript_10797:183-1049(+)